MKKLLLGLISLAFSLVLAPGAALAADRCVVADLSAPEEAHAIANSLDENQQPYRYISVEYTGNGPRYSVWLAEEPLPTAEPASESQLAPLDAPDTRTAMAQLLRSCALNMESYFDASSLNISYCDISAMYYQAILDNPDCFNTFTAYRYSYDPNGYVSYIYPQYLTDDPNEYTQMKAQFDATVAEALASLGCGANLSQLSDLDKTFALHNWLCDHADYNYDEVNKERGEETDWANYTAYGVLVNHIGVCQSYSLAFNTLLNLAGVECATIMVDPMNHAWNLVRVGGSWYHMDVTWDDSVMDISYWCFLKSDDAILGTGHHYWNLGPEHGVNGWYPEMACINTSLDDRDWYEYNPTLGPTHTWGSWQSASAATCTVGELRAHTCSTCGESQTEATSARLDHQWADWSVLVPSTCEEEGTLTMPCTQCDAVRQKPLEPTGHSYADEHADHCERCQMLRGDINTSGAVNIVDAQIAYDLACGHYAGSPLYEVLMTHANVNTAWGVDASDAFAIQHAIIFGW